MIVALIHPITINVNMYISVKFSYNQKFLYLHINQKYKWIILGKIYILLSQFNTWNSGHDIHMKYTFLKLVLINRYYKYDLISFLKLRLCFINPRNVNFE